MKNLFILITILLTTTSLSAQPPGGSLNQANVPTSVSSSADAVLLDFGQYINNQTSSRG